MTSIWFTIYNNLIKLHKHEDSDEVHEGGVELEGNVGGADVVRAGHHPLHAQSKTHSKIEPILARDAIFFLVENLIYMNINERIFSLLVLFYLLDPFVLLQKRLKLELLEENDAHEEEPKDAIAKVAEHVVEVTDEAQRFPGQKKY